MYRENCAEETLVKKTKRWVQGVLIWFLTIAASGSLTLAADVAEHRHFTGVCIVVAVSAVATLVAGIALAITASRFGLPE